MKCVLFILFFIFFPLLQGRADQPAGIIVGKYANIRSLPTVVNSQITVKAYHGSAIKILDKTTEKTHLEEIEGYWYQVELLEEGKKGWVFEKYIALEGSPQIQDFINKIVGSLYYYRPELDEQLKEIKSNLSRGNALDQAKKYNSRFLNYLGYRLLSEKNILAIPLLIAFMDPELKAENSSDANYTFTWEILQRLTPKTLVTSNFQSFKFWWQKNWGTIQMNIPSYELATIFKKIRENENRVYRKITDEP